MCREAAAKRIDRRLAPILSRIDTLQIEQSDKLTKELAFIHKSLHDRLIQDIYISQDSDWRLKNLKKRQYAIPDINSLNTMLPDFIKAMELIFAGESQYDQSYTPLILLELIRKYMYEGGIWQLRQEINDLLRNKNPLEIDKNTQVLTVDRPLRILVVSGLFPAIQHGGGLRLFDILHGLAAEHEVDLYSVYNREKDLHSLELIKDKLDNIWLIDDEQMIDHEVTKNDIENWLKDIGKNDHYYDVIQLEYPHTIYLTNFMKQYGGKVGFTFMECLTKSNVIKIQEMQTSNNLSEMSKFAGDLWRFAISEKFALENADFLIAVTPEDADFLERLCPRRPQVVPTCLSDLEIISKVEVSTVKAENGCVAFLGYFGHYPNIDSMKWYLTDIHPLLKSKLPEYKLLVIGAGDTSQLKELAREDDRVEFTGRVDDVIPYIQKASVCILPLITGAGIRGKLNQYSIAGRPSVSTTIGNKGLNYEHNVSVMIANEAPDFANAVMQLLTDNNKNSAMAAQAKTYAQANFTWDRHLKTLVEIFRG